MILRFGVVSGVTGCAATVLRRVPELVGAGAVRRSVRIGICRNIRVSVGRGRFWCKKVRPTEQYDHRQDGSDQKTRLILITGIFHKKKNISPGHARPYTTADISRYALDPSMFRVIAPDFSTACRAYAEHVGSNRHAGGRKGRKEIKPCKYPRRSKTKNFIPKKLSPRRIRANITNKNLLLFALHFALLAGKIFLTSRCVPQWLLIRLAACRVLRAAGFAADSKPNRILVVIASIFDAAQSKTLMQ